MKISFYIKLAWDSIRKNKQFYFPYILTCIGMVIMNYILIFLQQSSVINNIKGGSTVREMLSMGVGVMIIFSCIFMFYTNSFLMKRRKKEFGLYNILGMGKRHISFLLFLETVIIFLFTIVAGLTGGIILSKLAELGLLTILEAETNFRFTVSLSGIKMILEAFAVIFMLIFLNCLRQLWFTRTINLLKSESEGEKEPKANWLMAFVGLIILGCAYTLALKIKNPVAAMSAFFIAVVLVIIATYLLMISGSVVICKILRRNKNYYYRTKHFVSVSSMIYRMKRNGAGLASICILITMVMVMISSTAALYVGLEDSLRNRYPREINMSLLLEDEDQFSDENIDILRNDVKELAQKDSVDMTNTIDYKSACLAGILEDGVMHVNPDRAELFGGMNNSEVYQIFFVSLKEYNSMMKTNKTLEKGEAYLYSNREKIQFEHIEFEPGEVYTIKGNLTEFVEDGEISMTVLPSLVFVVNDVTDAVRNFTNSEGEPLYFYNWKYEFDTDLSTESEKNFTEEIEKTFLDHLSNFDREFVGISNIESRNIEKLDYIGIYAGLLYLGILLSIMFLAATVLIIYYKQISEGYEDKKRFDIMQRVGITKEEIKKSINSQMQTIFFLPIVGAGIHICFAYSLIEKILMMLNLQNRKLFVATTLGSYLIFVLFYIIVYKITSNSYYKIVSQAKK